MKKSMKVKSSLLGIACGILATMSVGATTVCVTGGLHTKNPIYSAPKGYAVTCGYKTITAKCSVSKKDHTTRSVSSKKKLSKDCFGSVETDWIYGPTWESSGTKFTSKHTGYDTWGSYTTLSASKKF